MASVVVSSVTGDKIRNLRDKMLNIISELKETPSKYLYMCTSHLLLNVILLINNKAFNFCSKCSLQ